MITVGIVDSCVEKKKCGLVTLVTGCALHNGTTVLKLHIRTNFAGIYLADMEIVVNEFPNKLDIEVVKDMLRSSVTHWLLNKKLAYPRIEKVNFVLTAERINHDTAKTH